jgi:hypothetical protein
MVGSRFGRLQVVEKVESVKGNSMWAALCDCGRRVVVRESSLRRGDTKSCGCYRNEVLTKKPTIDLLGERFFRLTVVKRVVNPHKSGATWLCKCDCGNDHITTGLNLRRGQVKSCGCLAKENKFRSFTKSALPAGQAAKNYVLSRYKTAAKVRKLVWALDKETFFALIQERCHYCGSTPSQTLPANLRKRATCEGFQYTGVDRKDNSQGYTSLNVVPCCTECNRLKRELPYTTFIGYLDRVVEFRTRVGSVK